MDEVSNQLLWVGAYAAVTLFYSAVAFVGVWATRRTVGRMPTAVRATVREEGLFGWRPLLWLSAPTTVAFWYCSFVMVRDPYIVGFLVSLPIVLLLVIPRLRVWVRATRIDLPKKTKNHLMLWTAIQSYAAVAAWGYWIGTAWEIRNLVALLSRS